MNHEACRSGPEGAAFARSASQDSLDELSMDDYWKEVENIHETRGSNHEEPVVVKEPDEGELEEEWLKEAGLSNLFAESSGDSLESMVFLSTLTRTQRAAVEKRVETVTQTMRKRNKQHHIPDVRDIFRLENDSKGKVCDGSDPSAVPAGETKPEAQDGTKGNAKQLPAFISPFLLSFNPLSIWSLSATQALQRPRHCKWASSSLLPPRRVGSLGSLPSWHSVRL
ncbi:rho GTPase-activating protein 18-like [Melanerpes formicivorus]|uniref:rho GTPase-activating protein 18-like n=1 Tax=Melanerpes formicivorus TaxID=211600 RepID=UPI00358EAFCD